MEEEWKDCWDFKELKNTRSPWIEGSAISQHQLLSGHMFHRHMLYAITVVNQEPPKIHRKINEGINVGWWTSLMGGGNLALIAYWCFHRCLKFPTSGLLYNLVISEVKVILWTRWTGADNKLLSSKFEGSPSIAFIWVSYYRTFFLLTFVGILILVGLDSGILWLIKINCWVVSLDPAGWWFGSGGRKASLSVDLLHRRKEDQNEVYWRVCC